MLSKATLNNEIGCHWESISFSEKKIMGFYQNDREINEIRNKSDKKWFRSYPGGLRFNSSNYNPLRKFFLIFSCNLNGHPDNRAKYPERGRPQLTHPQDIFHERYQPNNRLQTKNANFKTVL